MIGRLTLWALGASISAGCATRSSAPAYRMESIQLRPVAAADLALIRAQASESQAAAAEVWARAMRPAPGK